MIRISGDSASEALKLTHNKPYEEQIAEKALKPRVAHFRKIYDIFRRPPTMIDEGLVLYFKSPNSFTGEDMIEF